MCRKSRGDRGEINEVLRGKNGKSKQSINSSRLCFKRNDDDRASAAGLKRGEYTSLFCLFFLSTIYKIKELAT